MKKLMSIAISILFALSMTGFAFAQAVDKPAPEPTKAEVKAPKVEKKKLKESEKSKKAKKAKKAKKTEEAAPAAEKK